MKGKGGINNLSLSHCIPIQGKWVSISVCAVQEFVFLGEFTLAAMDTKTTTMVVQYGILFLFIFVIFR